MRAIDRFTELGVPFERARTLEELAKLRRGSEARSLLAMALDEYIALGAVPSVQRVQALLARDSS